MVEVVCVTRSAGGCRPWTCIDPCTSIGGDVFGHCGHQEKCEEREREREDCNDGTGEGKAVVTVQKKESRGLWLSCVSPTDGTQAVASLTALRAYRVACVVCLVGLALPIVSIRLTPGCSN